MRLLASCCPRSISWWTGVVDQSARTHTTASTGGRQMRWRCGRAVVGQTSGIQPAVLEEQERSCSGCVTTSLRLPNGPELIATTFMTHRNGNLGCRMVSATSLHLRNQSIQQSYALPSPRRHHGGQCVWATPSSMCRGHHHRAALAIGTIGLILIPEHFASGL